MNYIPLFSYAWYLVAKSTHASPLHQWPKFLSTYATLYFLNNILRPLKLILVGFTTPKIDRCFSWLVRRGLGKKRAVFLAPRALGLKRNEALTSQNRPK